MEQDLFGDKQTINIGSLYENGQMGFNTDFHETTVYYECCSSSCREIKSQSCQELKVFKFVVRSNHNHATEV